MQSFSASCHFLPLRSKYSPLHPFLKYNLCSYLGVRDHVSHRYETTGEIMGLYILAFNFLEDTGRQETLNRMVLSIPQI
jgi:hypothetical protein